MKAIVVLLSLLLLSGCGVRPMGTNTGNPDLKSSPATDRDGALGLGGYVCEKVSQCFSGVSANQCFDQIASLYAYTSELGPAAFRFSTLQTLDEAEKAGEIKVNKESRAQCVQAILDLKCDDSLMRAAYSAQASGDFHATNRLFRSAPDCRRIY